MMRKVHLDVSRVHRRHILEVRISLDAEQVVQNRDLKFSFPAGGSKVYYLLTRTRTTRDATEKKKKLVGSRETRKR